MKSRCYCQNGESYKHYAASSRISPPPGPNLVVGVSSRQQPF
jgi:hypothetical protein